MTASGAPPGDGHDGGAGGGNGERDGGYAGFVSRAAAFVVDTLLIGALATAAALLVSATIDALFAPRRGVEVAPVVLGVEVWATALVYRVFFWSVVGSTPAMWFLGLELSRVTGGRVGVARAVLRYFAYGISALAFGLGYAWVIVDPRHQAWHDKIARTVVRYSPHPAGARRGPRPRAPRPGH